MLAWIGQCWTPPKLKHYLVVRSREAATRGATACPGRTKRGRGIARLGKASAGIRAPMSARSRLARRRLGLAQAVCASCVGAGRLIDAVHHVRGIGHSVE